jgi:hypothetical protein
VSASASGTDSGLRGSNRACGDMLNTLIPAAAEYSPVKVARHVIGCHLKQETRVAELLIYLQQAASSNLNVPNLNKRNPPP